MKVWKSYGAEHSLSLVIIGRFKEIADAEEFESLVKTLTEDLRNLSGFDIGADRYGPELLDYLGKKDIFCMSPQQLGQLFYERNMERQGNKIRIDSDDDLNALVSLLVHQGAKVEVFSAHHYPEESE